MAGEDTPRRVHVWEVRAALERCMMAGRGRVYLTVDELREEGGGVVTPLAQITWAAVWDALALDPEDEDDEEPRG
jgi:hypothetical protein